MSSIEAKKHFDRLHHKLTIETGWPCYKVFNQAHKRINRGVGKRATIKVQRSMQDKVSTPIHQVRQVRQVRVLNSGLERQERWQ